MATWEDVDRIAGSLPGTVADAGERPAWRAGRKAFVWDRPLRKSDLAHLGEAAPTGQVIGLHVADLDAKDAVLHTEAPVFTTPHFDGYAMVLVDLDHCDVSLLEELVTDSWIARAPKRAVREYLAGGSDPTVR